MRFRVVIAMPLMLVGIWRSFASESGNPNKEELQKIKQSLERILTDNIIPFWYPQTIDRENGGYRLNHDTQGKWQGPSNKFIVSQARNVWFFARLYNSPYGKKEHLEAAKHGYEFLRDKMWDKEFGGFYSEVSSSGDSATVSSKHLYGQSFGLYALTEYAKASGDASALELARKLFNTLESRAYDTKNGGYREFFQRDWTIPPATAVSFMGIGPDIKLYNTHLHLMEPMTPYYLATCDSVARQRLIELIFIESNTILQKHIGACADRHSLDWTPIQDPKFYRASYGHDLENIWLLVDACDAAGIPNVPMMNLYRSLFDYALTYGFDWERGGFYYTGPYNKPAEDRSKSWWVQAEALVSALRMYRLTGERMYFDCFTKTLDWVVKRQVDWKNGDWFADIRADGTPSGMKAGPWKAAYHNGRSMLECLKILESLIEK